MLETYLKLWQLLDRRERRQTCLLLMLVVAMGLLQMAGVAAVMPFMSVVANPNVVETNSYLASIYHFFGFERSLSFLLFLAVTVFLAVMLSIAVKAVTIYANTRFSYMRSFSLSRKLMEGYLHQPYEWFLARHSADLGKNILAEAERVVVLALGPSLQLISEGVVVLAVLTLLVIIDPLLALLLAAGAGGIYTVIYVLLRRPLKRVGAVRFEANQSRFQAVQEAFGSIKDVKVAGLEGELLKRFDAPALRFARAESYQIVAAKLPHFALEATAFGGLLVMVIYLLADVGSLEKSLPVLAVYAFGAYRLLPALRYFYGSLVSLRFAGPALQTLHNDLRMLNSEENGSLPVQRSKPLGVAKSISLRDVTFRYANSDRTAVERLSIDIPARSTVGIIGHTGCGKTTTVDVILGLLLPQHGVIEVDGEPITSANLREWQATIGYVPQSIYLTDGSIRENIAFGVPKDDVVEESVERASRVANLHEFVVNELPFGYETQVGERGVRLSGGQRQRVGLARALYHDPDLLILDEATSALDTLTERAVLDAVNKLGSRKTIIMIAHRLSTVEGCDTIYLLESGRLVAQGSYSELKESSSLFQTMISG